MINKCILNNDTWKNVYEYVLHGTKQQEKNRMLIQIIKNLMINIGELNEKVEKLEKETNVIYLCNKKECGEVCPNPECNHTTKLEHAANFKAITDEDGKVLYYEEISRE